MFKVGQKYKVILKEPINPRLSFGDVLEVTAVIFGEGHCEEGVVISRDDLMMGFVALVVEPEVSHPHAELMAQYAEDAAKTDKPWLLWEYLKPAGVAWIDCQHNPCWISDRNYRRIPQTITVNNIEVPVGLTREQAKNLYENGGEYWFVYVDNVCEGRYYGVESYMYE